MEEEKNLIKAVFSLQKLGLTEFLPLQIRLSKDRTEFIEKLLQKNPK